MDGGLGSDDIIFLGQEEDIIPPSQSKLSLTFNRSQKKK